MKKALLILLLLALGVSEAQAQYGRGYGRGYGNGYGGGGRSRLPEAGPEPKAEEIQPSDIVEERLPDYQAAFDLDPFETEVLREILKNYYAELIAMQKDKTADAELMRKSYERVQEEFKSKLGSILDKEEVEKFIAMDFSPKAKRKRKKKRDNDN